MPNTPQLNRRIRDIGLEIFERAEAAVPRVWQKAWWLEQMTRMVERDDRLKTRAFEFVECLPALSSNEAIARHLSEYLDPRHVPAPRLLLALTGPGWAQRTRENLIGFAARFGATQMAGRFIAGHDPVSTLRTIERLRTEGMTFTLDVLGESTSSTRQAEAYVQAYAELIEAVCPVAARWRSVAVLDEEDTRGAAESPPVRRATPRVNVSIKLTSLDPHFDAIDPERARRNVCDRLRPLLRLARRHGAFVNVDMESSSVRALTLDLFESLMMEDEFRDWCDVGIVVQAYLTDGERDLRRLIDWGRRRGQRFAIRLVKGAYWDAETAAAVRHHKAPPVWIRKWESDACYERMARVMLGNVDCIRPTFASHNVRSLAFVIATAESLGRTTGEYELQNLYGMGDPLKAALVRMNQCVRVYLPCGALMPGMGYLIRRLLENTSNDGFLKQAFGDRSAHEPLLADPELARPPSTALPRRRYQNSDPEEPMSGFVNASNTSFATEENRRKMRDAIAYVRGECGRHVPGLIGHETITTGTWWDSVNPARPDEVVGHIALCGAADVDRAVATARSAAGPWRATAPAHRAAILRQAADGLERRRFELAAGMVLECGKPWREADADVTEAIDHCRYYADQIERICARPRRRDIPGEQNVILYAPKGVCAVISPYAFPLAIPTGMITAALAAGNTVLFKPARHASFTAAKLVNILDDAGAPPGVVHFLPGEGAVVGSHLVQHPEVQVVAFTGSHDVGLRVLADGAHTRPGQTSIRKMIVEMGGNNAIIIDDDADLDGALRAVIESAFVQAGQKCSSCSRAIVLDRVYDDFCDRLVAAARSLPIGPAEDPGTWVGPMIDAEARDRVLDYVRIGQSEARLLHQAVLPPSCADGFFAPPTIFADVAPGARIATEEIFGPVLSVIRAGDFEEALRIANATRYALTGGVFSRSPAHIDLARREFEVGNLYINRRIIGSQVDAQPFGGFKRSGTGIKAGSPDYLLAFMDARCITENTLRSGLVPDESAIAAP
jgi:RHH-type proline utilization regulon transcriptional repressor/proline dehydrogenase/delta 1-pyrroline-5-carboxylate dehydrogenase